MLFLFRFDYIGALSSTHGFTIVAQLESCLNQGSRCRICSFGYLFNNHERKTKMNIIVHGGQAHLDDYVACAEALVATLWLRLRSDPVMTLGDVLPEVEIFRRDPTPEELADPGTLVLDVGNQLNPTRSNFDHHQLPRGSRDCAMTLFAKSVPVFGRGSTDDPGDCLYAFMAKAYPWYETRAAMDSCGPFATAKEQGVEWGTVASFLGPFEDIVLGQFEDADPRERVRVVAPLARDILRRHEAMSRMLDALGYCTADRPGMSVMIYDFTAADPSDVDAVSDAVLAPVADGVAVFHDNRGNGMTLLRLKDDPRVDFSKLEGADGVVFAHKGGFIAKTAGKLTRAGMKALVEKALVPEAF